MGTQRFVVGLDPIDLVSELALTVGTSYTLECVLGHPRVKLWEGGALAPVAADRSSFHTVRPGKRIGLKPATSTPIWCWSTSANRSRIVVTEMA